MTQVFKTTLPQRFAAPPISEAKRCRFRKQSVAEKISHGFSAKCARLACFASPRGKPLVATIAHRAKIAYAHAWSVGHATGRRQRWQIALANTLATTDWWPC